MKKVYGPMTLERKARIGELWRQGKPMNVISKDIEKPPATVFSYLLYHGGIEPVARKRRPDCLSFEERESISGALARGDRLRSIARDLSRAPSTISREISRNGGANR
jgi:IS30 family transposase